MQHRFIILAALFGVSGVAIGAFGAHGLAPILEANGREATFQTATEYQMYHALALLGVAWVSTQWPGRFMQWAGYLFTAGIMLFSGSLYLLAILDIGVMGAIAPIGGGVLVAGWALLGWGTWRGGAKRRS
jgi:uncharacterized membrane protein YgdD (TMEM256/DUF423 family)